MKEGKFIHYCWFGGKPLPKLAKKCLASWKRYFPDYEIICWNEANCDFSECEFVKKAYEEKYYAFVADYVRAKALYEMGGVYFDTDMEVIKDIKDLMVDCKTFLGVEDTGKVACGVWYEKKPNGYLAKKLLEKYQSMKDVNFDNRANFSIPLLTTEILESCGFDYKKRRIQTLEHEVKIFPREYFYPYSYNRTNNLFTDNTYMIHYYDASWLPKKNQIENYLVRHCGRVRALKIIKAYQKSYVVMRKMGKIVLFPITIKRARQKKSEKIDEEYLKRVKNTLEEIEKNSNAPYVVLYNGSWFGVSSATKELFEYTVDCRELYRKEDIKKIADTLVKSNIKQVIFSAMSEGGAMLIKTLFKLAPTIKIKVFWHGSMSQVLDDYGWKVHKQIMNLCRKGNIGAFATCKESLYEFYKRQGVKVYFITNKVNECNVKKVDRNENDKVRVGLYAASPSNWRKNMFSQIAGVALIKDVVLDLVPLDIVAEEFARSLGVEVTGVSKNLTRNELMKRMSINDVNLYVTFSECSPMLPLESLEMGVPCVTGNNHHYFKDGELKKYLVVDQEANPVQIKEKIILCVKERKKIMKAYTIFRKKNNENERENLKEFLEA